MYDDEDDPVVEEFPVYLCRDLEEKLFIFQYPLQPTGVSSSFNIIKSQVKPGNQEVILEVGLDTSSPNYDRSHGEQIAQSVSKDKSNSTSAASKCVDRVRYESRRADLEEGGYAVGTMSQGALVLSPLRGGVSLTPSLSFLVNSTQDEVIAAAPEEEAKMVRVQFSKVETERSKKLRESSYSYYCQKSAEEPWYQTDYHDNSSPLAQVERQKLGGRRGTTSGEELVPLSCEHYLDQLAARQQISAQPESLQQRALRLLKRVSCVRASVAADNLGVTEAEVIPCLQAAGVLVQGVWVLRSDQRFVGGSQSVPQEQLVKARDYILLQFVEGKPIDRSKLSETVRLPSEILYELLSEVGRLNSNRVWVFKHPTDYNFISRHPETVEQEGLLWEARGSQLAEGLLGGGGGARRRRRDSARRRGNSLSEDDVGPETGKRGRKKSECDIKPDISTLAGPKS